MSIEHHMQKICNNDIHIQFTNINDINCFFRLQLDAYKKSINLLKSFKIRINELITKQFSLYDNESRVKEIINSSITLLYGNMLTLFATKYRNIQLFNLSINEQSVPGYRVCINYCEQGVCQSFIYKINSLRLQHNNKNLQMIKIVHNNIYNIPESIILIGEKTLKMETLNEILINYIKSIDLAIDKLKVYEYNFINLINNFDGIILSQG